MTKKNVLAKLWLRWEKIVEQTFNVMLNLIQHLFNRPRIKSGVTIKTNPTNDHHHTHITAHRNAFSLISRSLLDHKILLTGLIVLTIGAPIVYLSLKYQSNTQAAWYDDNWTYRQTVNITNSGSAQTDYQVNIGIGTSALINSGKMKSDCSDIRVTDNNGKVLAYWIETGDNDCNSSNNSTNVWTKAPSIPTSGATLYIYYGNSSAASTADGNQVFTFFDDFSGSSIDSTKWADQTGTWTISGGTLYSSANNSAIHQTNTSGSRVMEVRAKGATTGSETRFGLANGNYTDYLSQAGEDGPFWHLWAGGLVYEDSMISGSGTQYQQGTYLADTYDVYKISLNIGATANFYQDNVLKKAINSNVTSASLGVWLSNDSTSSVQTTYDWVFTRKYAATEPSVAAPTNEEKTPGPIAYWKFDEGYATTAYNSVSNNSLNGTINSGASWRPESECLSGKCLYMNKTDSDIDVAGVNLDATQNWTVSTWIKVPSVGGSNGAIFAVNGSYTFYFNSNQTLLNTYWGTTLYTVPIENNKWIHVALTRNGNTFTTYIDGVAKGSGSTSATTSGANLFIGSQTGSGSYMQGFIDEFKIYKYTRTAAQIKSDYAAGLAHAGAAKGISASMGSNSKNNSALSQGLVGYWKLDETSSPAQDSSGVGTTGIWNGSISGITGKFGIGSSFNGGDSFISLDAGATNVPSGSSNITVSAWVKWANTPSGNQVVVAYGGNNSATGFLLQYENTRKLEFALAGIATASSGVTPTAGQWYHLVGVYDHTNVYFYLNGVQYKTASTGNITSSTTFRFGNEYNRSYYQNGVMDEVRIYNRALSPTEIRQLADWAPGPVGYWNFEEGTGGTVNDSSGVGNTGTWNGTGSHWTNGKYGKAGQFNGSDDYITTSNHSESASQAFSASLWFYPTSNLSSPTGLFSHKQNAVSGWFIAAANTTQNKPAFFTSTGTYLVSSTAYIVNEWNHIAVTFSGGARAIYLNGQLVANDTGAAFGANNIPLTVGRYHSDESTGYFPGRIDEVRYYNYARTQKQIIEDMNAGHPSVGSPVGSAVGHYKFDEGYGSTAHNSGNGGSTLDATLGTGSSAPTWTTNGKFGKALSFDGGDNVSVTMPTSFTSISVSAWFKIASNGRRHSIYAQSDGTNDAINLYIENDDNFGFGMRDTDGSTWRSITFAFSDTSNWHHIVGTYDGDKMRVYLDGVLKNTSASFTNLATWNATANVGRSPTAPSYIMSGLIDEVKIYPYALTEDEVKLDYNRGAAMVLGTLSVNTGNTAPPSAASQEYCIPGDTTSCAPPVGRWDFNEGIGSTAYDTSGNNNIGTWNGTGSHWSNGKIGKAGQFNGSDDYIALTSMNNDQQGTFEAWVKPNTTTDICPRIFASSDNATNNNSFTVALDECNPGQTGQVSIAYISGGGWEVARGTTSVMDGKWHHIAATSNGSSYQIYVDGKAETVSGTNDGTWFGDISGRDNVTIGNLQRQTPSNYFSGSIDQVRIFDYARTPAQIAWDYNRGAPVGHWKFDEAQGTTAYDSTDPPAGGNNGNINIGASGTQTTAGTITSPTDGTGAWYNGRTGKLNYSLSFDGNDDYVSVPDSSTYFKMVHNYTISAWVYPVTLGTWNSIVVKSNPTAPDNKIYLQIKNDGSLINYNTISTAAGLITTGNWYHVVYAEDGTNEYLYINGLLKKQEATAQTTGFNYDGTINIGARLYPNPTPPQEPLTGQIDDVKIYNYALTPTQVKLLFNNGAAYFGPSTGSP